jgi:hypothetical protein
MVRTMAESQEYPRRKRAEKRRPIGRKRIDRKTNLVLKEGKVLDLPPGWEVTIPTERFSELTFDFELFRANGREDLARHFRDALWSLRYLSGQTLLAFRDRGLRAFWRFLDALEAEGKVITRLDQIDRRVLDLYLSWMDQQVCMTGPNKGEKWRAATKKGQYGEIKSLLKNCQSRVPEAVSTDLHFPLNPFPNIRRKTPPRRPYTGTEHLRIIEACRRDLETYHTGKWDQRDHQVLAFHLLTLALGCGANLQSLLEIRRGRDGVEESPVPGRFLVKLHKYRGYQTHSKSYRKADKPLEPTLFDCLVPADFEEHFESLCQHTEPLVKEARPADRTCAFLYRVPKLKRKGQVVRWDAGLARMALQRFGQRHDLRDDEGKLLKINLSRLRVTYGTQLYERTRDLLQVSRALGHSSVNITRRHYVHVTPEAQRNFSFAGRTMVGWVTSRDEKKAGKLSRELGIPRKTADKLLGGGYSNMIARCPNPFKQAGGKCEKWWGCFGCDSMVVFEDDLWRLFSCYYCVLNMRKRLGEHLWGELYGDIVKIIDRDITPQFDPDVVEDAKRRAKENPHPAWKLRDCEEP